jgi:hypothetical protein
LSYGTIFPASVANCPVALDAQINNSTLNKAFFAGIIFVYIITDQQMNGF